MMVECKCQIMGELVSCGHLPPNIKETKKALLSKYQTNKKGFLQNPLSQNILKTKKGFTSIINNSIIKTPYIN
jgi:hypothetical protein